MQDGSYADAGELFESLGDYRDSYEKAQACLLELALECLADQNVEDAFFFVDSMDEDTYATFLTEYDKRFADLRAIAVIEQLLIARSKDESNTEKTLYDVFEAENNGLAQLDELPGFADPDLEELVALYRDGVAKQFASCDADHKDYYDNHGFIEGAYNRACAIETMIAQYDLLKDYPEIAEEHEGSTDYFKAAYELQLALETMTIYQEKTGGNGKTYLPFKNTTKTAALMYFQTHHYNGSTYLGAVEAYLTILPGDTVYIPTERPEGCNNWYTDWTYLDIYLEEEQKLMPGVYKLQSAIIEGIFYDMEALAAYGLTPDSVVVTVNADGTGTWQEVGETVSISYSSSLIAVDGTDQRQSYTAGPNKLVVFFDNSVYTLALESAAA